MFKEFPDWFKAANLTVSNSEVLERWEAIAKVAPTMNSASLRNAVALISGRSGNELDNWTTNFVQDIRNAGDVKQSDDHNSVDVQLTLGAALHHILTESDLKLMAALAIRTASFAVLEPSVFLAPLSKLAGTVLRDVAVRNRTNILETPPLTLPTVDDQSQPLTYAAMTVTIDALNQALANLRRALAFRAEETDLLWWLASGHSEEFNTSLRQCEPPTAALLSGIAVSNLIAAIPGPANLRGILDAALTDAGLDSSGEQTLQGIIEHAQDDVLSHIAKTKALDNWRDLCPITAATRYYLNANKAPAWAEVCQAQLRFNMAEPHSLDAYAEELLVERLLLRITS